MVPIKAMKVIGVVESSSDATKVVIIHRGTCAFALKCEHAAKFGAKLFLIYKWVFARRTLRVCS